MSTETPNLGLVYIDPSQSQPEVKINDAWDKIDAAIGTPGVTVTEDGVNSPGDTILAKTIKFAGATVTPESGDVALVTISAGGTIQGITVNTTYLSESGTTIIALDLSTAAKATLAAALSSVSVTNSITGNGAGTALKLSGDSASPGNSFYYGTNASGTKGWYASGVSVTNSVTGDGVGTALKLSGDSASPGNSFFYGTNASGTKGWYASGVSVTNSITGDGVGTALKLSGDSASPGNNYRYGTDASGTKGWIASAATTKGDLVGFDTSPTRVAVGLDGQVLTANSANTKGVAWATPATGLIGAIPGTIPDLMLWMETDDILGAVGQQVMRLRERTPWLGGVGCANPQSTSTNSISATTINGLTTVKSGSGGFNIVNPFSLINGGGTIFAVVIGANATTTQAIVGGANNGLALYLAGVIGTLKCSLVKTGAAVIGSSSTAWVAGTAFQVNATYLASTGAFAFRQGRAAAGSGTGTTGAGATNMSFVGADTALTTANMSLASLALVIVYARVLSPTEITAVENYINAKWGV